jgi:hypothetical protein
LTKEKGGNELHAVNPDKNKINTSGLQKGVYILKNNEKSLKIVK